MTTSIRAAAAAAGLLAALALPVASRAATTSSAPPQSYTLHTQLSDRFHAGAFVGTLVMTIYPSGIVQGTYRPDDGGYRTVTGGVSGDQIWLDIGMERPLHVTGTFKNGVLQTVAQIPGLNTYTFESANVK